MQQIVHPTPTKSKMRKFPPSFDSATSTTSTADGGLVGEIVGLLVVGVDDGMLVVGVDDGTFVGAVNDGAAVGPTVGFEVVGVAVGETEGSVNVGATLGAKDAVHLDFDWEMH